MLQIPQGRSRRLGGTGAGPPPPPLGVEYLYPFADEPAQVTAELAFTLSPDADVQAVEVEIPPLKYNKSLLVLLTQDDCKHAAFSTTWAVINGRPLSDNYFYNAVQMRSDDLPPDVWSLGKTLGSTDGTGREVRFSFTTTLYMDDKIDVKPGFTTNFYRFFMKAGLVWANVREMVNYGVGIAFHDVNTTAVDNPDSILAHYHIAQNITLDRLKGRGCKMLAEPNGNKTYVTAARSYAPIQTIVLQSGGIGLRPFAVADDLPGQLLQRGFYDAAKLPAECEAILRQPVAERQALNIGVHGTDRSWAEALLWLNNKHGKDGDDCLWMPSVEEYYEYNYLRIHAKVSQRIENGVLHVTIQMPAAMYFYYPSLTLNLRGLTVEQCKAVDAGPSVTGLSWGGYSEGMMVNIDCRHALAAHAEHFVELFEASPSLPNKADARYFVSMLRESQQKDELLKRLK